MIETQRLPNLGEGIESGMIVGVLVAPGDQVSTGQMLFELEVDKVTVEIPVTVDGRIRELFVVMGSEVRVGDRMADIECRAAAADVSAGEAFKIDEMPTDPVRVDRLDTIEGQRKQPAPDIATVPIRADDHPAPAGPAARRMVRELGLDIRSVPGTGGRGRISRQDVIDHAGRLLRARPSPGPAALSNSPLPDLSPFGEIERRPVGTVQRATARNMARAWREIPHAWIQDRFDITVLENHRSRPRETGTDQAIPVSITPFILKGLAQTIQAFPLFNAFLDTLNDEIVQRRYIDIGVAVDTDRGLVVPVIRNVQNKDLSTIAGELRDLAARAREDALEIPELQGAGITLSNLGSLGVGSIFPIIAWPQSSIVGVGTARWGRTRNGEDEWVERLLLPVTLAIDHRLINGADGARFLGHLRRLLENPHDRLLI